VKRRPTQGPLAGKHFLVTGASSGIGAGIAGQLFAAGADLTLLGRDRERLRKTLRQAAARSVRHVVADFARRESLESAIREVRSGRTRLDGLIHCAGAFDRARLTESDAEQLANLMRVNVEAPIFLTLALRDRLAEESDVVFVNSSVVQRPAIDAACYAATKHALRSLADSLRQVVNVSGTRVTSLFPGRTATPMQEKIMRAEGRRYAPAELIQPADIAALVLCLLTLPRTVEVTEIFLRSALPLRSIAAPSRRKRRS
jgi:NADP-dependent 3-hydroxy acid dehydrogenase YdfG